MEIFLFWNLKDTIYSLLQFLKNNIGIENDQNDADRRMSFYEIDHENPKISQYDHAHSGSCSDY